MAADWSSLPPDLLRRIGDHQLAAGDIDCYMYMRSVCPSWRSVIPKPPPLGAGADLRFRPRHWVMLEEKEQKEAADGRRLFVNVSTGRFLRRRVPILHDHHLLATSEGLLVLRGKSSPHATCVLNPFTGSVLHAPDGHMTTRKKKTVYFVADPASVVRVVQYPQYSLADPGFSVNSMVVYAGHVYVVDWMGSVYRILDSEERPSDHDYRELITRMDDLIGDGMYLVESAGELLLIRAQLFCGAAQVYRVDLDHKVLESVHSIGRHALFLGHKSCLSVNADKFPSIHPNSLYHYRRHIMHPEFEILVRYDLSNGGRPEDDMNVKADDCLIGPVTLAKVLLDYCKVAVSGV